MRQVIRAFSITAYPVDTTLLKISCCGSDVFCIILLFGSKVSIGFLQLIGSGAKNSEALSYLGYLGCTVHALFVKTTAIKQ